MDCASSSSKVSSARFVGRVDQLAELCSALEDSAASRPSLAFVAGESGSGKTRLISELTSRAPEAGALVLCGDCVELGEGRAALRPADRGIAPAGAHAAPCAGCHGPEPARRFGHGDTRRRRALG